jgi:CRISPR/Cas system Type II protein with McrA/HNH and RuvC-like nuclease domain
MIKLKSIKNRNKCRKSWIHHSYWTIEEVMKLLQDNKGRKVITHNKVEIRLKSHKNILFLNKQHSCKICKLPVTYVALEKLQKDIKMYHFNYYTIHPKTKQEILFNVDHIIPKSKGGSDIITNMQLTCEICNTVKGNKISIFNYWLERIKGLFKWKK